MRIRGDGGIGLNPRASTVSKYGLTTPGGVTSPNAIIQASDAMAELAMSLSRSQGEFLALADKKSSTAASATGKASQSARKAARSFISVLETMNVSIEDALAGDARNGTFDLTFSGVVNQELTQPITGEWITLSTIVFVDHTGSAGSPYWAAFTWNVESLTVGGFTIRVRNTGAAPANTYGFKWIGVTNP